MDFSFRFFVVKQFSQEPTRLSQNVTMFPSRSWILLHTPQSLTIFCWRKIVVRFASCYFGVSLTLQPTQNPQHGRKGS